MMAATYKSQIMGWNWNVIVKSTLDDAVEHDDGDALNTIGCDGEGHVGSSYLGSVMSIFPSGKYYMPWTTNQTAEDVEKDSAFIEALDEIARRNGGSIDSGEGDPTDLYFMRYWTNEEIAQVRRALDD